MLATIPASPALHSHLSQQRYPFDNNDYPVYTTTQGAMDATTSFNKQHIHTRTNYRTLSPSAAAAAAKKGRARGPSFASTSSSSSCCYSPACAAATAASSSTTTTYSPTSRRVSQTSRPRPSWERGYNNDDDDDECSLDSCDDDAENDAFAFSYQYDCPPSAFVNTSRGTSLASRQLQKQQQHQCRPRSRSQSPFADADPLAPLSHSSSRNPYGDSPHSLALSLPPLSVSYEEESPLRSVALNEEYQAELRRERERELEYEREKEKVAAFEGYRKLTLGLGIRRKKYGVWNYEAEDLDTEKEKETPSGGRYSLDERPIRYSYDYDMDAAAAEEIDDEEADRLQDDDATPEFTPSCTQIVQRRWQALSLSWKTSVFRAKRRLRRRMGW